MMYTCWCPLIHNTLLLSLKYSYLLDNQTSHLTFILNNPSGDYLLLQNAFSTYHFRSQYNGPLLPQLLAYSLLL